MQLKETCEKRIHLMLLEQHLNEKQTDGYPFLCKQWCESNKCKVRAHLTWNRLEWKHFVCFHNIKTKHNPGLSRYWLEWKHGCAPDIYQRLTCDIITTFKAIFRQWKINILKVIHCVTHCFFRQCQQKLLLVKKTFTGVISDCIFVRFFLICIVKLPCTELFFITFIKKWEMCTSSETMCGEGKNCE